MFPASPANCGTINRRTALKAAAWTTPVIALAAAAPAHAASAAAVVPGLNGWIRFTVDQRGSLWDRRTVVELDARGTYPARGLWLNDVTSTTKLADIHLVFHVEADAGTPTFTRSGTGPWSNLTRVGTSTIGGARFTSYRASFTGTPTLQGSQAFVNNDFAYTSSGVTKSNPTRYIDRFATIDGTVQSFRRLVGGDNRLLPTTPYMAARMAAAPDAMSADGADDLSPETTDLALLHEAVS